jgi:hypothetical protein
MRSVETLADEDLRRRVPGSRPRSAGRARLPGFASRAAGVLEHGEWRVDLAVFLVRAKARADKIRVITIRDGDRAIAARQRSIPKDQELAELTRELDRGVVLRGLAERARQLGHEIGRWLRHDQENIAICTRCPARISARFDAATPIVDGEALDDTC